jgi:DNA-binding CsgD family transcriptional regulator
MALQWRPMQARDVLPCVDIIAGNPNIAARYGRWIRHLGPVWLRLLRSECMSTAVLEHADAPSASVGGLGVAVFVRDEFIRELKTPPLRWFGPELVARIISGKSPVLSDRELREANSGEGLNLLVWEAALSPQFAVQAEAYHVMVAAFIEAHKGFCLKEMITAQVDSVPRLQWAVNGGGLVWDPKKLCYARTITAKEEDLVEQPHIVGITRELELSRPGSWVGSLFNHQSPRLGFSPSEQRLLLLALGSRGHTDQELAKKLRVSVPAVKKNWVSIYRRVAGTQPQIIRACLDTPPGSSERGKEKRRLLLAYLHDHPEELRPVVRNLTTSRKNN